MACAAVRVCMYVKVKVEFGGISTRAYTRTQARGATPELRRVAGTTSHGLCPQAGTFHTDHATIGSPSPCLCRRPCGISSGRPHTRDRESESGQTPAELVSSISFLHATVKAC